MIRYTICFITCGDRLLLVNRQFTPNLGLWNGVGGKLEPGESPQESVIREVAEETGILLTAPRFAGVVTWGDRYNDTRGGMYVFLAEVDQAVPAGPVETPEGILAWKELSWVLNVENEGVVSNIHRFLPVMLQDPMPYRHHCVYRHGILKVCIRHHLQAGGDSSSPMEGWNQPT